jgi:hypothetical protein
MPKYHVTTHSGEEYEITADHIIVDESNTNRVTFSKTNGETVAQENNAASVRPA